MTCGLPVQNQSGLLKKELLWMVSASYWKWLFSVLHLGSAFLLYGSVGGWSRTWGAIKVLGELQDNWPNQRKSDCLVFNLCMLILARFNLCQIHLSYIIFTSLQFIVIPAGWKDQQLNYYIWMFISLKDGSRIKELHEEKKVVVRFYILGLKFYSCSKLLCWQQISCFCNVEWC